MIGVGGASGKDPLVHTGGMRVVGTMRVVLGVGVSVSVVLLEAIRHQLHSALSLGRRRRRKSW